jgi:beta-galactosidase
LAPACWWGGTAAQSLPRERISINDDWRFKKGDPPGHTGRLLYDVRPEVKDERDDRHADAEPQAAAGRGAASIPTLKRWILPTGNPFIKDTSARPKRPSENRGGDAAYVRRDFDDSSRGPGLDVYRSGRPAVQLRTRVITADAGSPMSELTTNRRPSGETS